MTISPEGRITDVNRATEQVTGVARQSLVGSDFSRYFTEPEKASAGYRKVLSDGFVHDYPLTIRHASGHTTDVLYNATVYRNAAGEVEGVFAAARDMTEHQRAEEAMAPVGRVGRTGAIARSGQRAGARPGRPDHALERRLPPALRLHGRRSPWPRQLRSAADALPPAAGDDPCDAHGDGPMEGRTGASSCRRA